LLALSDADLFYTIDHWVGGSTPSGMSSGISAETRSALGYTRGPAEADDLPHPCLDQPEGASEVPRSWRAPSPAQLRALLTAMDVDLFAQHVITPAYKYFHATFPEWYDGYTFNAHLANHLRQMRMPSPSHRLDDASRRGV
jgi:hypothetical protein